MERLEKCVGDIFEVNNNDTRMTSAVSFLDTCICYFFKKAILKNVLYGRTIKTPGCYYNSHLLNL